MASGHRHRTVRLARLLERGPSLRRAERRQVRKLLGRAWGLEWRVWGCTRRKDGSRAVNPDALNQTVLARVRAVGHVADRLKRPSP